MDTSPVMTHVEQREAMLARIEAILLEELQVPRSPGEIDPDTPLFGAGLALDSMDAMELVFAVEEAFGVKLPDVEHLHRWLRTPNRLADLVVEKRKLVETQRPETAR